MPITTTSSMHRGGSLSTKRRCWDCNDTAAAFIVEPASQHFLCAGCAAEYGLEMPAGPSDLPIGSIEYPDGRVEQREIDGD